MAATTIKVSSELRDRLNEVAATRGLTAGSLVEKLLDDWLWRQQIELAKSQMRAASKETWDDYLAEAKAWDVTLSDGLAEDPWEE